MKLPHFIKHDWTKWRKSRNQEDIFVEFFQKPDDFIRQEKRCRECPAKDTRNIPKKVKSKKARNK